MGPVTPLAIDILENAKLPTGDRHVAKLVMDIGDVLSDEGWKSLVLSDTDSRDLWDKTRADMLRLVDAIDRVKEVILNYRGSEVIGDAMYLPDDAHHRLWLLRAAALKAAEFAAEQSKVFEEALGEEWTRKEHLKYRVFMLLRDLYIELGGSKKIGVGGPLYRFVKGVVAVAGIGVEMPGEKVFQTTMMRAIKRPRIKRTSSFTRMP